ncbi:MAG: nicotinate-nucleotide--dimethylbenzimidazole phosphoribosyltransferase [Gammaproteobacteria bacterium]|nr:nicotinate-nucleotide--dimethylbenzimidazole phosphoribosyltransferase [Gammaproteobacteria bacterium]
MTATDWIHTPTAKIDRASIDAARERQAQLTKPPGSLGRLEEIAIAFAGWQATPVPRIDRVLVRVFAADHGIVAEGVSAFPQAVTVEMIRNFTRGGAAISVLSREAGADFRVINLGTAAPLGDADRANPLLRDVALAPGCANSCREPALSEDLLARALAAGAEEITEAAPSPQLFLAGEMGIGNSSSAAALASALLDEPATVTVGPGTGVAGPDLDRKRAAVARAVALHQSHCTTPFEALRRLGGLEIAALSGAYLAAAQRGVPSLVDGYICSVAALAACRINAGVRDWLLFAHRSVEPGHRHVLDALQAEPLLDLGMRLGEGSGAATALPLLRLACALHAGMATFAEAGVSTGA